MAIDRINPGRPPLLWSDVQEAFNIINQNFTVLDARTDDGSSGGVNFSTLFTDVSPANTNQFNLGQPNKTWKSLYLSAFIDSPNNDNNGLWIGTGQISGANGIINLPEGSTVGDELIINSDNTSFKTINVNSSNIIAESFTDTLNITSGAGLNVSTNLETKTINFVNNGVLSITGTGGQIGVSESTGNITLTNLGVLSLSNATYSPETPVAAPALNFNNRAPGAGIAISNSTGDITLTNTGVLSIVTGGAGILVSFDETTGRATITNSLPNIEQNVFTTISVLGKFELIEAGSRTDTLTLIEGLGITLTNNTSQKSITVDIDPQFDLTGSIFGAGNELLVDAVNNKIVGPVFADVTGNVEGSVTGDLKGSVFAEDSTLLVDGVNGLIPYSVVDGAPTALSQLSNDLDYAAIVGTTIQNNGLPVNTFLTGNLNAQGNNITGANLVNTTGDLTGSVFSDTSIMLINGVDGSVMYYPDEASNWSGVPPATVGEALDRLAAVVKALNSGVGA